MRKIAMSAAVVFLVAIGQFIDIGNTADFERIGFDRILERVVERDEFTDAIVTVAAFNDAPDPATKLSLTIKPIANSSNVLVELRDARDRNAVYESYRFRSSPKLNAEIEKLKRSTSASRPVNTKSKHVFLKIQHMLQSKDLCAPTSASMVLQYYGKQTSPEEIKNLAKAVTKDPDFPGTYFIDIVNGLKKTEVDWTYRDYPADAAGFESGMADLIKSLDSGNPVIVDTKVAPNGHTVVVNGYDPNRKLISLVDPLIPRPGYRQVTYTEFSGLWKSLTVDRRGAIFTRTPMK